MNYRKFGTTDLLLSEYGFGAWGIGGESYGSVNKADAISALCVAEENGCNFIDTAGVYGNSESIIGEFLSGRRSKWNLSTKFSGQRNGLVTTLEDQLKRLGTEYIDFYQIHWLPKAEDKLYDDLQKIKAEGKSRYIGISLYNQNDIDNVLNMDFIDGFQVAFNLLEPLPFLSSLEKIKKSQKGVLIRSSLQSGFLTGKYDKFSSFSDPKDQRSKLTQKELQKIFKNIESMKFLEESSGSLLYAAARYPLAFPESTCTLLGTKSAEQAKFNFHDIPSETLSTQELDKIYSVQQRLGLFKEETGYIKLLKSFKKILKKVRNPG